MRTGRLLRACCLTLVVALGAACGDAEDASSQAEDRAGATQGSDVFELTAYPSLVHQRGDAFYVTYHVTVVNKTPNILRAVEVDLALDSELDQYLAAGVISAPLSPVDLFPEGGLDPEGRPGMRGIDLVSEQLIAEADFLRDAGLDPSRILELDEAEVVVRWDGGEERLAFAAPVEDPEGLMADLQALTRTADH